MYRMYDKLHDVHPIYILVDDDQENKSVSLVNTRWRWNVDRMWLMIKESRFCEDSGIVTYMHIMHTSYLNCDIRAVREEHSQLVHDFLFLEIDGLQSWNLCLCVVKPELNLINEDHTVCTSHKCTESSQNAHCNTTSRRINSSCVKYLTLVCDFFSKYSTN